jgi:predicted transposase YbfD/YdcC
MDERKYKTLVEALAKVPDPRQRRGRRYPWVLLLTLVSAALASGQRNGRAIGQWVSEQSDELVAQLGWGGRALPSEATLRRAVRTVDVRRLEERISAFTPAPRGKRPARPTWEGIAIDGKEVRGALAHRVPVRLVAAVRHDGAVLAQTAVSAKGNEITAAPRLLRQLDLRGKVVTMDALLAQRRLARQIRAQGGHYLMVVKADQPEMLDALHLLFAEPPTGVSAAETVAHTSEKRHGRHEWRTLEASAALVGWLDWPAHQQALRRTCRRLRLSTGEVHQETTYAVTSLSPAEADAALLERLWRGHWTIENRVHYVRDVTWGEDAGQAYRGHTPQALAALRNALLLLLRAVGWTNIADALRHYGARVDRALRLVGVGPTGL